jgi:hypothetical protein
MVITSETALNPDDSRLSGPVDHQPSAAFTRLDSGQITTVAAGTGPHLSFSDAPPFNEARGGDYSGTQGP